MNLLLVEDDHLVMETLCDYLTVQGHTVDCAYNGQTALALMQKSIFDVVVMDIMMPRLDGLITVERLRVDERINTPIIFLTARDSLEDKLRAFAIGGDDYLVKPFALEELLVRITALAKRSSGQDLEGLSIGELRLHSHAQQIVHHEQPLKLSQIQYKLLSLLMRKSPALVTKRQILNDIWGDDEPESDVLRTHIYGLRSVLVETVQSPRLETVHGRGYRLVP